MLFDIFEKIYIINLPSRVDRKREIQDQLVRMGLRVDDPRVVFFPAVRPSDKDGFPTIGARGCFMSHLEVLRKIRDENLSTALILEDDCNFYYKNVSQLSLLEKILPESDWDIFYGGALQNRQLNPSVDGFVKIEPSIGIMGSHCIGVKSAVAGEIVDYLEKMLDRPAGDPNGGPMHVDGAYSWYRKINSARKTILSVPEIAYQRSSVTDVHEKTLLSEWAYKFAFFRQSMSSFRRLKNSILSKIK